MSSDLAQSSVYLKAEDREVIEKLMQRHGLMSRSQVIRLAIHRLYNETDGRDVQIRELADEIKRLA